MNLKTKVEKLEAGAMPDGHCPHLPPIVREFATDGALQRVTCRDADAATVTPPCACRRDRLEIHLHETPLAEMQNAQD
jgi:hypothetical protein